MARPDSGGLRRHGHVPRPEQVRQVQVALLLAEGDRGGGAEFVTVGSTARLLDGAAQLPNDLDVVIAPNDAAAFARVLARFSVGRGLRSVGASPQRVSTSWSPVDVFVEDEPPAWHRVVVDGTELRVADV